MLTSAGLSEGNGSSMYDSSFLQQELDGRKFANGHSADLM